MPPRRPPPLPRALFEADGPLGPGSAPLHPDPDTVHPPFVIDAHWFPRQAQYTPLPAVRGQHDGDRVEVRGVVQVQMDATRPSFIDNADQIMTISTYPTIINSTFPHPPSIASEANGAIDILLPFPKPLTEAEWDLVDEAVNALDESWARRPDEAAAAPKQGKGRKIVISGLLPPPFSRPSATLPQSDEFNLHLARLSQLSLHGNVYLKALPPSVVPGHAGQSNWWEHTAEFEGVVRMYVAHAIETFGTHRLLFGAAPAVPHAVTAPQRVPIKNEAWYQLLRKVLADLGLGRDDVADILGANAIGVYSLAR
ncbi:hypothetical protein Q5752_002652 [Cryptotrichosporon argae]